MPGMVAASFGLDVGSPVRTATRSPRCTWPRRDQTDASAFGLVTPSTRPLPGAATDRRQRRGLQATRSGRPDHSYRSTIRPTMQLRYRFSVTREGLPFKSNQYIPGRMAHRPSTDGALMLTQFHLREDTQIVSGTINWGGTSP